ncbi:MAG: permease [Bacillota bacterium]|nr:permease [Bacillota bacterium]
MKADLKRYALFALVAVADLILRLINPAQGQNAIMTAGNYLLEMLLFIPPIFVLVGLLEVWVPRKLVERHVGPQSGARGVIISVLVATAAAGPLYAAFPVADALLKKGCRMANAVIFLGTWATIKIPMLMMEIKFVGLEFAALRLALTLPAVILTGYAMERLMMFTKEKETQSKVQAG